MANNNYFQAGLDLWQTYAQAYTDFAVSTVQQGLNQSLALRERIDQVSADALKRSQELSRQEQETVLGAAESLQAQAKANAERIARLFQAPPQG